MYCVYGVDQDLLSRYHVSWLPEGEDLFNPSITYLRQAVPGKEPYKNDSMLTGHHDGKYYRPSTESIAIENKIQCARDSKWYFVDLAIYRGACDCVTFFDVVIAVYRLWLCTGTEPLDSLGIGAITAPFHGGRDYWFDRIPRGKARCNFPKATVVNATAGALPYNPQRPSIHSDSRGALNLSAGLHVQFTYTTDARFSTYSLLKANVTNEWNAENLTTSSGVNGPIDPYIYDLYNAVRLVEEFGMRVEELIYFETANGATFGYTQFLPGERVPGRFDMCECQNLYLCPNGTQSAAGSSGLLDCVSAEIDVLRRSSAIPSWINSSNPHIVNRTDLSMLSGYDVKTDEDRYTYGIGLISLESLEVATVTFNFSGLDSNMTYGTDYLIAAYVNCLPCPTRYVCNYEIDPMNCTSPSQAVQFENFHNCLLTNRLTSCLTKNGTNIPCGTNETYVTFKEPDYFKCLQLPFICAQVYWPPLVWKPAFESNRSRVAKAHVQEALGLKGIYVDPAWLLDNKLHPPMSLLEFEAQLGTSIPYVNAFVNDTRPPSAVPGCCACQRHDMPYFFKDEATVSGYFDDKHDYIQISLNALTKCTILLSVELINGKFYSSFDKYFVDVADISVFTPGRARYTPSSPSRMSFLAYFEEANYITAVDYPLNLPQSHYRIAGQSPTGPNTTSYQIQIENIVLIDRISQMNIGDQKYESRYKARQEQQFIQQELSRNVTGANFTKAATQFAKNLRVPNMTYLSNGIYGVSDPFSDVYPSSDWFSVADPSGTLDDGTNTSYIAVPYLPFFSNCKEFDSHIIFSKVVETNPACKLVPYEKTKPVEQFFLFTHFLPVGDQCLNTIPKSQQFGTWHNKTVQYYYGIRGAVFNCSYEEEITVTNPTNPRWFEQPAGTKIFSFTQNPVELINYESPSADGVGWGRSNYLRSLIGTLQEVGVNVYVNGSLNNVIPIHIQLIIGYYQVKRGYKRLVANGGAWLNYDQTIRCHTLTSGSAQQKKIEAMGIEQCALDVNGNIAEYQYQLEILYFPYNWWQLLNFFQFERVIYVFCYFMFNVFTLATGLFVWAINRLLTRLRYPPPFHYNNFYKIIFQASAIGCVLSSALFSFAMIWIWGWLMAYTDPNGVDQRGMICSKDPVNKPQAFCFEGIIGDWTYSVAITDTQIELWRVGRKGIAMLAMCIYFIFICSIFLIPKNCEVKPKEEEIDLVLGADSQEAPPPSIVWAPILWKRVNYILLTFLFIIILTFHMEFSYCNYFQNNVYYWFFYLKFIPSLLDFVLEILFHETLLWGHIQVCFQAIFNLMTVAANTFGAFLLSACVDVCLTVLQRLYTDPPLKVLAIETPKYIMMFQRLFRHRRRMTREQKAAEELKWRRLNEEIEISREGIEPVVDFYFGYCNDLASMYMAPVVYAFCAVFYFETQIANLYGIPVLSDMWYYYIFALFIIPFWLGMDIFLHNAIELVHGWKVYDFVCYQRYRFEIRQERWALYSTVVDASLAGVYQRMCLMCYSSQYFFIQTLAAYGMIAGIFGITIFLRYSYNPLNDPVFFVIIIIMFIFLEIARYICIRLMNIQIKRIGWRGLWATKIIEGTVDDDVAAKLAIGEGRQADLEAERLELQALNSERFRHRFLERNRPWILQHLVELLTPRALDQPGPDGRPVIEYVRDVYAELMGMGEGMKRAGDRAEISDDDGDELEVQRRNWPREPLTGAPLAIARLWLAKARKRRAFSKLVRGVIDQHQLDSCENCGRTAGQNDVRLVVHLTTDGEPDPYAIDRLIAMFEEHYGANELDPMLWKAFFRGQAQYMTRCSVCDNTVEQDKLRKAGNLPGPGRVTRAEDISSDEEDDEVVFEPVVVTRTSPECRMMNKWLSAARKKIGGIFPRPDARAQMDNYAKKMRQLKLNKSKVKLGKSGSEALAATALKAELQEKFGNVFFDAATKALARRWVRMAKESIEERFRMRSEKIREDLHLVLAQMPEEEDWYFGASTRNEGNELLELANVLDEDRKILYSEAAVKIRKIEADIEDYLQVRQRDLDRERQAFEVKMAEENDKVALEIEYRTAELEKEKQRKKESFDKIEKQAREEMGAAPTDMIQKHRRLLAQIDDQIVAEQTRALKIREDVEKVSRGNFDQEESIKKNEMMKRKLTANENILRIKNEMALKMKQAETEWQVRSSRWLSLGKRKVMVKQREDMEAKQSKKKRKGG